MPLPETRGRRPLWMTPYGREGMGDVWFDRFAQEWPRFIGRDYSPDLDLYEKDGKMILKAELPGVSKDDISISIENNVVTLTGKKTSEREEEGADYYVRESSFGSFSRSIRLPAEVDEDKVEAKFKDGILTLEMPASTTQRSKRIEISG